jgi:hypothetical protein
MSHTEWNPEAERVKWARHDAYFSDHFSKLYNAWIRLGFMEPEWTQDWARVVNNTLGWGDVELRCIPVWRVNWIPDVNMAAVCVDNTVPCGLIHTKITYMPCPDKTFHNNPELYDRWRVAMVGDMIRIKYSVPTGVNPVWQKLAEYYVERDFIRLGMYDRLKELTFNFTQHHRCHPFGHIIPPHSYFLKFANSFHIGLPVEQQETPSFSDDRIPLF